MLLQYIFINISIYIIKISVIIVYFLHAVLVLETGLEQPLLQHPDHHVHVLRLAPHTPQRLLEAHLQHRLVSSKNGCL